MNRSLAVCAFLVPIWVSGCSRKTEGTVEASSIVTAPILACPGRIETREDPLELGTAANGVIESILVKQNDRVRAGQVLARVSCRDLGAEVTQYESERKVAISIRARLIVGGRPEDRASARSRVEAAEMRLRERRAWYGRLQRLHDASEISDSDFDRAESEWHIAEADLRTFREQERAAAAEPLPEDLARVDADIRAAEDRIAAARARLEKCIVIAPIAGTVLRTFVTTGELMSAAYPKTLLTLVDLSRLRVRAEVDEQDVGKIGTAHRVSVSSEAFPGSPLIGHIDRMAPLMGRRRTRTGDPAEKSDRDVLEVLVNLDSLSVPPPLGLRVTVQFWP